MFGACADRVGDVRNRAPLVMRTGGFAALVGSTVVIFWTPLSTLIRFSFQEEHYSHIILVPAVTAVLLLYKRRTVFAQVETSWKAGIGLLAAGALVGWWGLAYAGSPSENDRLFITTSSLVLMWIGGFMVCFGWSAVRAGLFPVLFLVLMVPLPDLLLNAVIYSLQTGSAEVSYALFQLIGVPVFRTGFELALPGLTIEVAKECSGIRSSLALLFTSLLAGHLLLRSAWRKTALALITVPLLMIKNGIRIVTLSTLAIYADPSFLTGKLHSEGGFVFFLLALAILAPVLWFLQRSEANLQRSEANH